MNLFKTLPLLAFGALLMAGCGTHQDQKAAQETTPSPAVETPAPPPEDSTSPADTTDVMPSDEPAPATTDTLPPDEQQPSDEPAPPPNG